MDADRNLLFGVLALQADLLTPDRFAEACSAWAARKHTPLADLLVERGWLSPADRADIEKFLQRKLARHGGDVKASLAEVTTDQVRQSLAGLDDPDVRRSLTPPPAGHVLVHTTDYAPQARERYTLSRLHATGGIGRVWLARDASLGRDVALKELRPERAGQPAVWGRFLREAQVTGQLEHPGIVPVYELGRRPDDQAPFYTMRFVRGRTLAEAARAYHERRQRREAGPLELRELLTALVGVCNAVAYAHSRGVLHRDLKPQNVVLGDYGEVMVLDWGLAKLAGEPDGDADPVTVEADGGLPDDRTVAGQVLGTPAYMAPEQAEGRPDLLDARTDVYGLGAVLYEILTGRPPFAGPDTTAVLRRVVHEPPAPPRSAVPATPPALEAVCLKALAKRPADRYGSAKELARDVECWLADEPVGAYPEPWPQRAGRWTRRHRTAVAAAVAVLAVGAAALAVGNLLLNRANVAIENQRREAEEQRRLAEEQRKAAQDNLLYARATAEQFFLTIVQNRLLNSPHPGLHPLRRELLGAGLNLYQELVRRVGDNPAFREARANAYLRLGRVTMEMGLREEARTAFLQARDLYAQALAGAPPDPARCKDAQARNENNLGRLYLDLGETDDAVKVFQQAIAAHEELRRVGQREAKMFPPLASVEEELAWEYNNLAVALRRAGRWPEAARLYKQSAGVWEDLARRFDQNVNYRYGLGSAYANLGVNYHDTGHPAEALGAYRRGITDLRRAITLHQAQPTRSNDERVRLYAALALHLNGLGSLYTETGDRGKARAALEEARTVLADLARDNPDVAVVRERLAHTHGLLGDLETAEGDLDAALRSFEKALELTKAGPGAASGKSPQVGSAAAYHRDIGMVLLKRGRYPEALDSLRKAQALGEQAASATPDWRYYFAGLEALFSSAAGRGKATLSAEEEAERRRHAERAVQLLREAVALGYRNAARMKRDPCLSPLRDRPDFQKLVRELEGGSP